MTDEQLKWLQELPGNQRGGLYSDEPDKYERTCKCGATFWYNGHDGTLESWVETHFNHEAEKFYKAGSRYDFTKPIKFSHGGFIAFINEFGLDFTDIDPVDEDVISFANKQKDVFVFRFNDEITKFAPDLHCTFAPDLSNTQINA